MATEEFYDEIEKYLNGTLKGDKKIAFEKRMKSDKKLREEVNLHRDLSTFLGDPEEQAFYENIKKIGEEYSTKTQAKNQWSWLKILLPVTFLAMSVWWFAQSKTKAQVDENQIESTINTPTESEESKTNSKNTISKEEGDKVEN